MIKTPIDLQDLRRKIYTKAKADTAWRFWGLYVHVCKMETLHEAYLLAKKNNGAPGIDGVTFEAIEDSGVEVFLKQLQDELAAHTYRPLRNRRQEIPKGDGKVRVLGIPAIRDRVVQGALKLILEPIFEADFQPGSFGYRPGRTAHEAVQRVAEAIVKCKTRVIDIDLRAYFDNVRHDVLLAKVATRVRDGDVLHLLKMMLKASGQKGVPQGGVITPPTMLRTAPFGAWFKRAGAHLVHNLDFLRPHFDSLDQRPKNLTPSLPVRILQPCADLFRK
jgi:RNA-directed DNA polymerase